MKTILLSSWGNLEPCELDKPTADNGYAVIKVIYGGVCGSDITIYNGQHPTATAPVVLCHEILGRIDQLPEGYEGDWRIGDRVLVNPVVPCGECSTCQNGLENVCENLKLLGIHINGGFAQYSRASLGRLVRVDDTMPDSIAALGEPFAVAYHVNKRAGTKKNDNILVIGAGTIGIVVALTARELGARAVISEINPKRLKLAFDMGFETINPLLCDIKDKAHSLIGTSGFDIVCDASGAKASILALPDLCRPGGKLLSLGMSSMPYEFVVGKVSFKELMLVGSRLYSHDDFIFGMQMLQKISSCQDISPIISDILPLSQLLQAVQMMKEGGNIGKILMICNSET